MATSKETSFALLATRSSRGIELVDPLDPSNSHGSLNASKNCRVMVFSRDGKSLAWCDGEKLFVYDVQSRKVDYALEFPRTRCLVFSPQSSLLASWQPYSTTPDNPQAAANLRVWKGTDLVTEYIHKRQDSWMPQWSDDEELSSRAVSTEIQFYEGPVPGGHFVHKLRAEGLSSYRLAPGPPPYHVAVFVKSYKGHPAFVRLYRYPALESIIASRSFFRGDSVSFYWNKKGTAVLALSSTEVDKTGASYYGEQSLHFLSTRGDGCLVNLDKKGPVYFVEWSPVGNEFCVVYGFMPSRTTVFNLKCEPVFDFGTSHRNTICYNPHGNILLLGGFGNLRGEVEIWNILKRKIICQTQASDTTHLEWSPDGTHIATATTAPRLREDNGYKLWHFSGAMMKEYPINKPVELWEIKWQPRPLDQCPTPDPDQKDALVKQTTPIPSKPAAYVPPAMRGKQFKPFKLHDDEPDTKKEEDPLSKMAQKNKKKRDAKKKTATEPRSQEQQDLLNIAAYITGSSSSAKPTMGSSQQPSNTHGNEDKSLRSAEQEKKLKNLKKKIKQIEDLRKQQESGKVLESNQVEKMKMESSILDEIAKLDLN